MPVTTQSDQLTEAVITTENATSGMAHFAAQLRLSQLDTALVSLASMHILDSLAVAVAASTTVHARQVVSTLERIGSFGNATIIGSDLRTTCVDAALANGTMAHGIDFDDSHQLVHSGSAIVPAALAMCEDIGATGEQFLISTIVGYEVAIRVSLAAGVQHKKRGYHPTASCNVFGATAAAARALELDTQQMESALGISASQSAGLSQYRFNGSPVKHLHAGLAARGGVLSALLAEQGMTGPMQALEGRFGFLNVLSDGGYPALICDRIGQYYHLSEMEIKPFPSCRQTHAPVDLALQLVAEHPGLANNISNLYLDTYSYAQESWFMNPTPETPLSAMLSIPFSVASALRFGALRLEHFDPDAVADTVTRALSARIQIRVDPAFDTVWPKQRRSRLSITLANGQHLTADTDNPRGGPAAPLTMAEVTDKAMGLMGPVLGTSSAQHVVDVVLNLSACKDIRDLTALLSISD